MKDTDGNIVLFGVDISLQDYNEKSILVGNNMNLKLSDVVSITDGASMIEQPGEKAFGVTVQDFDVAVLIPDGASIDEQPGEITVTLEDIDVAVIIPDGASKDEHLGENFDTPI